VYKARLRETGEVVAVKVQRPGIGESIAVDMLLLRRLMAVVDRNLPQISQPLVPLVDEFAGRLFAGGFERIWRGGGCVCLQVGAFVLGQGSRVHQSGWGGQVVGRGSGGGPQPAPDQPAPGAPGGRIRGAPVCRWVGGLGT
jgi:hypothetical protein